jgi:hypothetical protein
MWSLTSLRTKRIRSFRKFRELAFQQQQPGTSSLLVFGAAALFVFLVLAALVFATGAGSEMRQSLGTAVFAGMLGETAFGLRVLYGGSQDRAQEGAGLEQNQSVKRTTSLLVTTAVRPTHVRIFN